MQQNNPQDCTTARGPTVILLLTRQSSLSVVQRAPWTLQGSPSHVECENNDLQSTSGFTITKLKWVTTIIFTFSVSWGILRRLLWGSLHPRRLLLPLVCKRAPGSFAIWATCPLPCKVFYCSYWTMEEFGNHSQRWMLESYIPLTGNVIVELHLGQWYSNFFNQDPCFRMTVCPGPIGSDVTTKNVIVWTYIEKRGWPYPANNFRVLKYDIHHLWL